MVRRWWTAFAVCVVLALFCGFLTIGAIAAASDDLTAGERHDDMIGAIVVGALTLVLIVGAIHAEHRARRARASSGLPLGGVQVQPAGGPGLAPDLAGLSAGTERARRPRVARRRQDTWHSPVGLSVMMVVMAALTAMFAAASVHVYHDNQRFVATKAHGTLASATITDNTVRAHSSRGGKTYTTKIALALATPVYGVANESISLSGRRTGAYYQPGSNVSVLVDPDDPHYAVFVGETTSDGATWIVLLCLAMAAGAVGVLAGVGQVRLRRRAAVATQASGSASYLT